MPAKATGARLRGTAKPNSDGRLRPYANGNAILRLGHLGALVVRA
jgi:hypothetical protein